MENSFSPKYVIIALIIVVIILAGILYWQYQKPPISPLEEGLSLETGGQIVHKPWSDTAEKYYPGGGNAIDFRDGAQGNFEIKTSKTGETLRLDWPNEIKAIHVKVYDIGTLSNLQDHEVVFDIVNWDMNNPLEITEESPTSTIPESFPQPNVYISSTYKIGDVPEGFFENSLIQEESQNIFEIGKRYSIELIGVNKEGKLLEGYYTFTHE